MPGIDEILTGLGLASQVAGPFLNIPSQAELQRQAPFAARAFDAILKSAPNNTQAQNEQLFSQYQQTFGKQFGDIHPLQTMANIQTEQRGTQLATGTDALSQVFGPEIAGLVQQGPDGQPDFRAAIQAASLMDRRQTAQALAEKDADTTFPQKDFLKMQQAAAKDITTAIANKQPEVAQSRFEQFQLAARSVGVDIPDLPVQGTQPATSLGGIFNSESRIPLLGGLRADVPIPRTPTDFNSAIFSAGPRASQTLPETLPPVTEDIHPAIQQAQAGPQERFATRGDIRVDPDVPRITVQNEFDISELSKQITEPVEVRFTTPGGDIFGTVRPDIESLRQPTPDEVAEASIVPDGGAIQELEAIRPGLAMATPTAKEAKAQSEESGVSAEIADLLAQGVVISRQLSPVREELASEEKAIAELQKEIAAARPLNVRGSQQMSALRVNRAAAKQAKIDVKKAIDPVRKELAKEELASLTRDLTERFTADAIEKIIAEAEEKTKQAGGRSAEKQIELQQRLDNVERLQQEIDSLSSL